VPHDVIFLTKPQIALDQVRSTVAVGTEAEVALADARYGTDTEFHDGITEIDLPYVFSIQSSPSPVAAPQRAIALERIIVTLRDVGLFRS